MFPEHADHNCQNVLVVIIENGKLGRGECMYRSMKHYLFSNLCCSLCLVNNESWGPGVRADGEGTDEFSAKILPCLIVSP